MKLLPIVTFGLVVYHAGAEEDTRVLQKLDVSGLEFSATFQDDPLSEGGSWILSKNSKYIDQDVEVRALGIEGFENEKELILKTPNSFYGIGAHFSEPIVNSDGKDLVIQYEVALPEKHTCGGAYLKFLRAPLSKDELTLLSNETPYSIMFGPDKCGKTDKVHFILQQRNPVTGIWEEKHLETPPRVKSDKLSHLYTLVLHGSNGTYELFVDMKSESKGPLLSAMKPPLQPPKTISDPEDIKPDNWVDDANIPDPKATKPVDWDESAPPTIPDPNADKPLGWLDNEPPMIQDVNFPKPDLWDDEEDGEFEPPLVQNPLCLEAPGCGTWTPPVIANPEYKGKWVPPMIPNPEYKGPFIPRDIPNPEYFEVKKPAEVPPIAGVAIEVWTTSGGIVMDNIVVSYDLDSAFAFGKRTWEPKFSAQKIAFSVPQKDKDSSRISTVEYQRKLLEEGGFMNTLKAGVLIAEEWVGNLWEDMNANPKAAIGTLGAIFIGLLMLIFMTFSRKKKADRRGGPANDEGFEEMKQNSTEPITQAAPSYDNAGVSDKNEPSSDAEDRKK